VENISEKIIFHFIPFQCRTSGLKSTAVCSKLHNRAKGNADGCCSQHTDTVLGCVRVGLCQCTQAVWKNYLEPQLNKVAQLILKLWLVYG